MYLVLEGGDGCGKSVQAKRLASWLRDSRGVSVRHLREPGSTPAGEALRNLLLQPETGSLQPWTEALLFFAARAEMLAREVRPTLQRGGAVVVERCYLSTWVYQGVVQQAVVQQAVAEPAIQSGDGHPALETLRTLTYQVHGDTLPDRIFVLDVDHETAMQRIGRRSTTDRFEARGEDFIRSVRQGYLEVAALEPRARLVDASGSLDEVQESLRVAVQELWA